MKPIKWNCMVCEKKQFNVRNKICRKCRKKFMKK